MYNFFNLSRRFPILKLTFVGAGSMAEAIISGLIEKNIFSHEQIYVTNHQNKQRLATLAHTYGIKGSYDNHELFDQANIIVLAMKPKDVKDALETIRPYVSHHTLIISVIAGISTSFIAQNLSQSQSIARAMPNTSAAVGKSATAISVNSYVTKEQEQMAMDLFSAIGISVIVEEKQLDAVTGISGSGPAYFYFVVESMQKAAEQLGLDKEMATLLIHQTIYGAAEMLMSSQKDAQELRSKVTSPGGTTEAGINRMKELKLDESIVEGIKAASIRSQQLAEQFEKN